MHVGHILIYEIIYLNITSWILSQYSSYKGSLRIKLCMSIYDWMKDTVDSLEDLHERTIISLFVALKVLQL